MGCAGAERKSHKPANLTFFCTSFAWPSTVALGFSMVHCPKRKADGSYRPITFFQLGV